MPHIISGLSLLVLYILQMTIFSQSPLLSGTTDLILLFLAAWSLQPQVKNSWIWTLISGVLISIISAMPFYTPLIAYIGIVGISKLIQSKVWKTPIFAMFIVTFIGTVFQHVIYVVALQIIGAQISWGESIDRVILPSVLLNLIFALPIYAMVNDLAGRAYPLEEEL